MLAPPPPPPAPPPSPPDVGVEVVQPSSIEPSQSLSILSEHTSVAAGLIEASLSLQSSPDLSSES